MTRILVIDDDPSVGVAIQTLLVRQGCDVVLAPNGHVGIDALENSNFDAVLIDLFMPGMDGLETIKGIRNRAPLMPIVAMSGFRFYESTGAIPDFLGMAAEQGATCCLHKPFGPQQLLAAINACLDQTFPQERAVRA